ncbi:MAG: DUF309 domain-containing protein [Ignavibacteria bacterium]|nr:MAG: DUF309 domain-containing protein [Ignavibacteria bacterium]
MNFQDELLKGVALFNDHEFFQAHDVFEDIWMECKNEEKLFFQGMVQISVGCFHAISGNMRGANSQLEKGIEKLKKFSPLHRKIDLKSLIIDINVLSLEVKKQINDKVGIGYESFPKIKLNLS